MTEELESVFPVNESTPKIKKSVVTRKKLGQEIGKAIAEKSRGLFSADDWQCNKCGNVNWARRNHCNVCKTPKYGVVEERTGYGGGYNERDAIEYVQRDDSDNEYDEFGRKKKSKKIQNDDSNEEDSDEDLSKYDLSDWGEEKVKNRDRSRSPNTIELKQ